MTSTGTSAPSYSTSASTPSYSSTSVPLKRLGPVRENATFYSKKSSEAASYVYGYLKFYAPKSLLPQINQLEDTVSSYSYPAFAKIQDRSDSILKTLDGQVDYVTKQAGSYYGSATEGVNNVHKTHVQRFHNSKAAYSGKISEASQYIEHHGVTGFIRSVADSIMGKASEAGKTAEKQVGAVEGQVKNAWFNFYDLPIVQKVSSDVNSLTSFAWTKYMSGHDAVLGHPIYHDVYKGGQDTVSSVQGTSLYQKAKTQLYPIVAPYADPALDNITSSSYYKAGVDHLKPVQSNGKL